MCASAGRAEPKLLDLVSEAVRTRRYSPRTEETYRRWITRFVRFHGTRHPEGLGADEVNAFLSHLAVEAGVSAATQSQARAALLFLYKEVLHRPLAGVGDRVVQGKKPKRLPTVITRAEVRQVLGQLSGMQQLVASVLYGSGLRLREGLGLRVKDIDLDRRQLVIRGGKGGHDRVSVLAGALTVPLADQIEWRRTMHDRDLAKGVGRAVLPDSYARKAPRAALEFAWQFVFPASTVTEHPQSGAKGRYHLHPTSVQRAVKKASRTLGLGKRVTCHTFRHSFATHLLEDGYDIRTIQELLGHRSVKTTMIYTHVLNSGGLGIRSPLDTI